MQFLTGIKPSTFLSTHEEWHALAIGFCEVLCPRKPRHPIGAAALTPLEGEEHYYLFGRALGVIAWLIILPIVIGKIIQEAFW